MQRNHGVLIYPGHMNASSMVDTPESFGTVPLVCEELREAINGINLPPKANGKESKMNITAFLHTPIRVTEFFRLVGRLRSRRLEAEARR